MPKKNQGLFTDSDLGMQRAIPRRDFLQGTLVAAASTLAGGLLKGYAAEGTVPPAAQDEPGYYPPALTGMRGSHPGSFEAAHSLKDAGSQPRAADTDESYDLVVVGAGISGLAAAHFFRARTSSTARILLLDNHDDFGGHAKRNEFMLPGGIQLANGGTVSIESPSPYSEVAEGLIREIGIDAATLSKSTEHSKLYDELGLRNGVFFDRETFGSDKLVVGWGQLPIREVLAQTPLPQAAQHDIARLEATHTDFLPGLSSTQKKIKLSAISYRDFLRDVVHADPATIAFYQARTHGLWGAGIDAVSALDCWGSGLPGFEGMKLEPGSIPRMGFTPAGFVDTGGSPVMHFPDGNATIARLLVRNLIPSAVPGNTAEDVVTARVDYGKLDRPDSSVRVRLNSTVIRAKNAGAADRPGQVEVTYVRAGKAAVVRAKSCILACWNMIIPYLCPELPAEQKAALHSLVKTPLVYTRVAVRNWQAFAKLGIRGVYAPGSYHSNIHLNPKVDIGSYRSPSSPKEPILVTMTRTPCQPGLSEHEQHRVGRADLLATSFASFERNIREQLVRTLGGGGFDPAEDILAITVNRWPHGYAPEYNPLFDPLLPEAQQPHVIGRARFGRIAIANSDSGRAAYTSSAIDQAHRAVADLLG